MFFLPMWRKYKNFAQPVKASFWFLLAGLVRNGISFFSTPIFTRIMTTAQFGEFSLYISWYGVLSIFGTMNLSYGVYNKGLIKFSKDRASFTSAFQGLSSALTLSMSLIFVPFSTHWSKLFNIPALCVIAMFIQMLFEPAYSFWSVSQRFNYKYKAVVATSILLAILTPLISILSICISSHPSQARILSFSLVQAGFCSIFYVLNLHRSKTLFHKGYWKYALVFNLPLIPHYLSAIALQQSDRIMISSMIGTGEAGIYSVAYNLSMVMTVVTQAIHNTFVPFTYKALKNEEYHSVYKRASSVLLVVCCIILFIIAFAPEVIRIIAPPKYSGAIWVIPPVATSVYFMFLYPLFANIEFYYEKTSFITIASLVGAVMNIALNYLLLPVFGYVTAGYTTLFCYILFACSHMLAFKKILKEQGITAPIYNLRFFFFVSISMLVLMACITLTYNNPFIRYGIIVGVLTMLIYNRKTVIAVLKQNVHNGGNL